jgi:hypothetical protein
LGEKIKNLVMKKMYATVAFLMVSAICWAPLTDFRLRLETIRETSQQLHIRYHETEFNRFINDLGYRESRGNWLCINHIGCFGEWQFAEATLKYLGFRNITLRKFRANPMIFPKELQEEALKALIRVNMIYLKDYDSFLGKTVKGIVVTKTGLMAAAHLGGAGSVKQFLASGGKLDHKDSLGTAVSDDLKRFSNYEIE